MPASLQTALCTGFLSPCEGPPFEHRLSWFYRLYRWRSPRAVPPPLAVPSPSYKHRIVGARQAHRASRPTPSRTGHPSKPFFHLSLEWPLHLSHLSLTWSIPVCHILLSRPMHLFHLGSCR